MLKRLVGNYTNSADENINFEWCCRPVLKAINLFGIPLRMHKADETLSVWIVNIFGWMLYFVNVVTGLMIIFLDGGTANGTPANRDAVWSNRTTAWRWNNGISTYNNVGSTLSIQTALLAITAVRWPDLASVLERMERAHHFGPKELTLFRATFRSGSVAIVTSCLAVSGLAISAYFDAGLQLWQMILYSFQRYLFIFILLAAILFVCFGVMASTMLQLIGQEMAQLVARPADARPSQVLICQWSRRYFTIIDLVHQMNRCFGCLLLFILAPAFVRFINSSFHLMIEMKDGRWTINVTVQWVILLVYFLAFTFMANIPHRIRQAAVDLTKKLRRLHLEDDALQNQVNTLMMEIANSLPKLTAAGFFDVDLQLIPTLIGTTLTYLIILFHQFQTSEKH